MIPCINQHNKLFRKKKSDAKVVLAGSRVDATIAVVLDIALSGPAGKIPHLIRVEFPWLVTFITRTCQIKDQLQPNHHETISKQLRHWHKLK